MADFPIGKAYDGGDWRIDPSQAAQFAEVLGMGVDAVPPMFHVRGVVPKLLQPIQADPELDVDVLRLVHAGHDVRFHRLLEPGDVVRLRGTLVGVSDKRAGRLYTLGVRGDVDDVPVFEGNTTLFVRAAAPPPSLGSSSGGARPRGPDPDVEITQVTQPDLAERYAPVSGDLNPIHTDPEVAREAGLDGCILHGLCTLGLAQRDLVQHLAGGDVSRLRRLGVRFARPVVPGSALTLRVWLGDDAHRFETRDAAGKAVLSHGVVELS